MPALPVLLPLALMAVAIVAALAIGGLFFLKQSGERRANRLYGALLILGGLTQLHFALDFGGWLISDPWLRYLPIYFSLWLPVLLFSHVKISLYPSYQFRWTDMKHLTLPIGQTLYFLAIWLFPSFRHETGRYFYNPFYGGLEQALFLFGWPLYVLFSVLYLRRKRAALNMRSLPRLLWYLRKLLKGVLLFILAYAILSVADVLAFKYLLTDLRSRVWYAGAQALSFTVLLLWLCVYGGQVLVWGRALRVAVQKP
ncbi:hypothetical protein FUA23_18890 [Neolewinella aurantiaca]|uniref:Uncharacterized protein n=1 Tax=Neolewinella aurantiaca TaxID=2602767 RepID=A0A5C7F8S5_9BACT|nr:hypothetical protein [Neolewinella aurantiaca]TXF87062.1 hypothetical protein FUA23_18890 [Neolewinella aurantiaca]